MKNTVAKELGFKDYRDYCSSPLWREIRKRILKKYPWCVKCGKAATLIHHKKYTERVMLGAEDAYLSCCQRCHLWAHGVDRSGNAHYNARTATNLLRGKKVRTRKKRKVFKVKAPSPPAQKAKRTPNYQPGFSIPVRCISELGKR